MDTSDKVMLGGLGLMLYLIYTQDDLKLSFLPEMEASPQSNMNIPSPPSNQSEIQNQKTTTPVTSSEELRTNIWQVKSVSGYLKELSIWFKTNYTPLENACIIDAGHDDVSYIYKPLAGTLSYTQLFTESKDVGARPKSDYFFSNFGIDSVAFNSTFEAFRDTFSINVYPALKTASLDTVLSRFADEFSIFHTKDSVRFFYEHRNELLVSKELWNKYFLQNNIIALDEGYYNTKNSVTFKYWLTSKEIRNYIKRSLNRDFIPLKHYSMPRLSIKDRVNFVTSFIRGVGQTGGNILTAPNSNRRIYVFLVSFHCDSGNTHQFNQKLRLKLFTPPSGVYQYPYSVKFAEFAKEDILRVYNNETAWMYHYFNAPIQTLKNMFQRCFTFSALDIEIKSHPNFALTNTPAVHDSYKVTPNKYGGIIYIPLLVEVGWMQDIKQIFAFSSKTMRTIIAVGLIRAMQRTIDYFNK